MACIRKRRGKYVVDYRDASAIRRWVTCDTKREADDVLAEKIQESRQATKPTVDPKIRLSDYALKWLDDITASVKPRTLQSYEQTLKLHVRPELGHIRLRALDRGRIKAFLAAKLKSGRRKKASGRKKSNATTNPGLAKNSVRIIYATLRAMYNAAIDDGVVLRNPVEKLGKTLGLTVSKNARQETIKAFSREQLTSFLDKAPVIQPRLAPLFFTLARTGMRLGEVLALQPDDLNFKEREIRIERAFSDGELQTPKSGHGRTVDMSLQLAALLQRLEVERKAETLRRGWKTIPPWVFCSSEGTPLDPANMRRAFKHVLKTAGLPRHFTVHSLRHTYASLLIQQGESPAYVQRQLGHASIQLTVDTYGKWLPLGNKAAVDRLDETREKADGSKTVANGDFATDAAEAPKAVTAGNPKTKN